MQRVAIIHPWMPQYRVNFFETLIESLAEKNIHLDVYYGQTPPEWTARQDNASPDYAQELSTRFFKIGNRNVSIKTLAPLAHHKYDLLILEQAIRNLETYKAILDPRTPNSIAFWGHGRTYTKSKSGTEERFKQFITRRGSWFFGYTQDGVNAVVAAGYPQSKTTVVQNSIDTDEFRDNLARASQHDLDQFTSQHSLTSGHTALYIGGLDSAKRIDLLLEAGKRIHRIDPKFRLIVIGDGDQAALVDEWQQENVWIYRHPPAFGINKAIAFRASDFILNPGRVGLIAVDSLTSGLPIVTTDWPYHAPEFAYLEADKTMVLAKDNIEDLVARAAKLAESPQLRSALRANCLRESRKYSTSAMVHRFAIGIQHALSSRQD